MGTLQKLKTKIELNAEKTNSMSIKTPQKPRKLEDKKQSGFASTTVGSKFMGGAHSGMSIPQKRNHKKKQ